MNTVAIDRNTLNGLFDNQKKLDELFDSIFGDDNCFISISPTPSQSGSRYSDFDTKSHYSYGGNLKESLLAIKPNRFYYAIPILLEIAVIYLAVTNLL